MQIVCNKPRTYKLNSRSSQGLGENICKLILRADKSVQISLHNNFSQMK